MFAATRCKRNSQTGPNRSTNLPSCQHSTQTKLAFEHTDRRFDSTTKALQLPEPRDSLMQFFCLAQAAHLWDGNFLNTGFAQLQRVLGSVIAAIGRQFFGLYAESGFGVVQHRQQSTDDRLQQTFSSQKPISIDRCGAKSLQIVLFQ